MSVYSFQDNCKMQTKICKSTPKTTNDFMDNFVNYETKFTNHNFDLNDDSNNFSDSDDDLFEIEDVLTPSYKVAGSIPSLIIDSSDEEDDDDDYYNDSESLSSENFNVDNTQINNWNSNPLSPSLNPGSNSINVDISNKRAHSLTFDSIFTSKKPLSPSIITSVAADNYNLWLSGM